MFDKSHISPLSYRHNYSRFFSRRNNLIRLVLAALLVLSSLGIIILKPWAELGDSGIISKGGPLSEDEASDTNSAKTNWKIDLDEVLSRSSAFRREQFTDEALKENRLIPVTAILLGWKRIESLQVVVNYISRYPYIKEILIWNNNDNTRLHKEVIT